MPLATRAFSFLLRPLAALLALYILGSSAYHIQQQRPNISGELYAVTIISGVAALWAILSSLLTCCAKRPALLMPMLFFDLVFMGGFVAIAVLQRNAARAKCNNKLCKVDKAAFSMAVANAVLFLLLALLTHSLYRAYRRSRAFGPGPENGYSTTPASSVPRNQRWTRGSEETAMTEGNTGAFTRTAGYRSDGLGTAGYREPLGTSTLETGRGSFDPELGSHQPVKTHQAF